MRMAPLRLALMATGMALGTNLLLYALARLAGVPFQVAPPGRPPEEVGLAAVALAVFFLMLFPPLAAASDPRTELSLIALHVPPVAFYLWGLVRMEEAL
jgi:hypothetical protein